jgi:hypothetical protein
MADQDNRLADVLSPFLLEKSYDPAFDLFTRFPFRKSKIAPSLSTEGRGNVLLFALLVAGFTYATHAADLFGYLR